MTSINGLGNGCYIPSQDTYNSYERRVQAELQPHCGNPFERDAYVGAAAIVGFGAGFEAGFAAGALSQFPGQLPAAAPAAAPKKKKKKMSRLKRHLRRHLKMAKKHLGHMKKLGQSIPIVGSFFGGNQQRPMLPMG